MTFFFAHVERKRVFAVLILFYNFKFENVYLLKIDFNSPMKKKIVSLLFQISATYPHLSIPVIPKSRSLSISNPSLYLQISRNGLASFIRPGGKDHQLGLRKPSVFRTQGIQELTTQRTFPRGSCLNFHKEKSLVAERS